MAPGSNSYNGLANTPSMVPAAESLRDSGEVLTSTKFEVGFLGHEKQDAKSFAKWDVGKKSVARDGLLRGSFCS